jgi:hypothetical protein
LALRVKKRVHQGNFIELKRHDAEPRMNALPEDGGRTA